MNSIETRLGQMMMIGFRGRDVGDGSEIRRAVEQCRIGGVWLTDNNSPMGATHGNISSPRQLEELTQALQDHAFIPLFVALDGEGGRVIRLKPEFGFPTFLSAQELGRRNDLDLTRQQARTLAETLRSVGINFNFAPVLDLGLNLDNPALGGKARCYAADVETTVRHATAVIEEHRAVGLLCTVKHFPGHGSTIADSHIDMPDISDTWSPEELEPFRRLIAADLPAGVMSGHVLLRRYDAERPATLSPKLLTDVLRNELGFKGLIFTDDLNMGAIAKRFGYEEAVAMAVEAGADIILNANVANHEEGIAERTHNALLEHVRSGRISEERIAESFERIKTAKHRLNLL